MDHLEGYAKTLPGIDISKMFDENLAKFLREQHAIAVFGYSDIEIIGAITEEIQGPETAIIFNYDQIMGNECEKQTCPYFASLPGTFKITSNYTDRWYFSVSNKTEEPMEIYPFTITEEGEPFSDAFIIRLRPEPVGNDPEIMALGYAHGWICKMLDKGHDPRGETANAPALLEDYLKDFEKTT